MPDTPFRTPEIGHDHTAGPEYLTFAGLLVDYEEGLSPSMERFNKVADLRAEMLMLVARLSRDYPCPPEPDRAEESDK